jgi:hypothetical protein
MSVLENSAGKDTLVVYSVEFPIAQDLDYFTSATDGGAQGNFSIASSVPGDAVFRSAQGKLPLGAEGRRLVLTKTDASGSTLTCSVAIEGYRFGKFQSEVVVMDTGGTQTSNSQKIYDEVTSLSIAEIANYAASDVLTVVVDDAWIGLPVPISSIDAIRSSFKIAAGTPAAGGPKVNSDVTAAMVKLENNGSGLDVKALHSGAIAVTDRYLLKVINNGWKNTIARGGTQKLF